MSRLTLRSGGQVTGDRGDWKCNSQGHIGRKCNVRVSSYAAAARVPPARSQASPAPPGVPGSQSLSRGNTPGSQWQLPGRFPWRLFTMRLWRGRRRSI